MLVKDGPASPASPSFSQALIPFVSKSPRADPAVIGELFRADVKI